MSAPASLRTALALGGQAGKRRPMVRKRTDPPAGLITLGDDVAQSHDRQNPKARSSSAV